MAVLKTFQKRVAERRRLHLDYDRWLEDDELLTNLTFAVLPVTAPVLAIDQWFFDPGNRRAVIFASGGLSLTSYTITITATTDEGQIKLDDIGLKVKP